MGLLNKLKKGNSPKEENKFETLFSIACDYDGYDMVFLENSTEPELYAQINDMLTNSKVCMGNIEAYKDLTKGSSIDEFYAFYDEWVEYLRNCGFVFRLNHDVSIDYFVDGINTMLKVNGYNFLLDKNRIIDIYRKELEILGIDSMVKYDVLIANTVTAELRKINLELINLFNGFDNCDFAIIPVCKIDKLKKLEEKIKL